MEESKKIKKVKSSDGKTEFNEQLDDHGGKPYYNRMKNHVTLAINHLGNQRDEKERKQELKEMIGNIPRWENAGNKK